MSSIPGYYTPEEAAAVIGVHQSQISRYIQDELLTAERVGNWQLLLPCDQVDNFQRPKRGNPAFAKKAAAKRPATRSKKSRK